MKKHLKNQLVTGFVFAFIAVVGLGACSSKNAQTAENSDTLAASTATPSSADKANLGAGSAGRGR